MRYVALRVIALSAAVSLSSWAKDKAPPLRRRMPSGEIPSYSITFKEGEPVPGVGAALAIRLPFECTADGTVFITTVQPLGAGDRPSNLAQFSPSYLLMSVARTGEAHSFPLNQIPELSDITDIDHFVSDSGVVFLLRATRGMSGSDSESPAKAEHHLYIVKFTLDGTYQKMIQLEDPFSIYRIGVFPSGNYLAFGFDERDHASKLAMLNEDGSVSEYLQVAKADMPESAVGTLHATGKGPPVYLAQMQFIVRKHSIYIAQSKTDFPVLEVRESGAIRAIRTRLPRSLRIDMLIPSDKNIYARADGIKDLIFELNSETGAVIRELAVLPGQAGANVACVNDEDFLSFRSTKGRLVPLTGSAEPAASTELRVDNH